MLFSGGDLVRRSDTDFSNGDLKDDLKRAGFEDCVADNIADRVDDRKAKGWTYDVGRQEAIREAELIINSSKAALDNFAGKTEQMRIQEMSQLELGMNG